MEVLPGIFPDGGSTRKQSCIPKEIESNLELLGTRQPKIYYSKRDIQMMKNLIKRNIRKPLAALIMLQSLHSQIYLLYLDYLDGMYQICL
jgi:hypothetical protein